MIWRGLVTPSIIQATTKNLNERAGVDLISLMISKPSSYSKKEVMAWIE